MEFRRATIEDIPQLLEFRIALLRSAVGEGKTEQWEIMKQKSIEYYQKSLKDNTHSAYMVYDGEVCIGTGGICFYEILPTYYKPTGKKAYIINMYTRPEYRKRGIATQVLNLLVRDALNQGYTYISLEATKMGQALYEKCGFAFLQSEMQFVNETFGDKQ